MIHPNKEAFAMPKLWKLMQAVAMGVAFLAIPVAAQAQFFDKPGFGGGYRFGPPPPIIYAPPPRIWKPPPVYYAPPQRFYHPPQPRAFFGPPHGFYFPPHAFFAPPHSFYAPPRDFYGSRPYYGRPHDHRRHW